MFAKEAGLDAAEHDSVASFSCGSEEDDKDLYSEEKAIEHVAKDWQAKESPLDETAIVRHATSRCIHRLIDQGGTHLACGRAMSTRYEVQGVKTEVLPPFVWHLLQRPLAYENRFQMAAACRFRCANIRI